MKYRPSMTYRDVMWLRRNYLPAMIYWDDVRAAVKKREKGLCQYCHREGLDVHHAKYNGVLFFEHKFVKDRTILQFVCRSCHDLIEDRKRRKKMVSRWGKVGRSVAKWVL